MPQVDFYFARQDEVRMVQRAIDQGATLVVGGQYRTRAYDTLKSMIEYLHARAGGEPLFFIVAPVFSRCPLVMDQIEEGPNRGKFFIRQREGGPTIDFLCPFPYVQEGVEYIPHGMLGYHPTFWNPVTEQNEKAPTEQKRFFAELLKEVRREATTVPLRGRCYWVGPGAMQRRAEGSKLGAPAEVERLLVSDPSLRPRRVAARTRSE